MDIMEKFPSEKRLIDASKWDEFYQEMTKDLKPYDHYDDGYRDAMDNVDDWIGGNQVEAEPVVRCRECKYHNKPLCPMRLSFNWTEDDDFCSYGERKEGTD